MSQCYCGHHMGTGVLYLLKESLLEYYSHLWSYWRMSHLYCKDLGLWVVGGVNVLHL